MSKPLTAFTVGLLGFYRCDHMTLGLVNEADMFQRLMETCLGDLQLNWCLIYLDDVIVFSKTPKENLTLRRAFFEKLKKAGLKLKPVSVSFFKKSLTYLGHKISEGGIETDSRKIKIIQEGPVLKTVTEVRSFLGFTNYYHKLSAQASLSSLC